MFKIVTETEDSIYLEAGSGLIPRKKVKEGEKWIKHVWLSSAIFHVLSWFGDANGNTSVGCSEPDCIINKDRKIVH